MEYIILFGIIGVLIFIAPLISKTILVPVVVVEMLLGAFVANLGIVAESNLLREMGHVGFLFLMFLAGIEVDLRSFKRLSNAFVKRIFIYFFTLYAAAILIAWLVHLPIIYVVAFPVMSLGMIVMLIQEYGKDCEWLDLCLKIGIIGELISILMLVLLDGYHLFGNSLELYKSLFSVIVFLCAMVCIFKLASIVLWWFPRLRLLLIPDVSTMNQDVRYCVMLFFVMLTIVSFLRIEAVLGAFLSGLIISQFFRHKKSLHHKLNDFGFGFFVPIFFVHIGITLDIKIIIENKIILLHASYICATMLLIRLVATSIAFWSFFKNLKSVVLFSLGTSMPLTFLVATATVGLNIGAIEREQYYSFVLAAILESVLFMVVMKAISHFRK